MKISKTLFSAALLGVLAGCTGQPRPTLQQQMTGMNAEERADFLYHECRKEAQNYSTKRYSGQHNDHYHAEPETESSRYRMQILCNEFYEATTGQNH